MKIYPNRENKRYILVKFTQMKNKTSLLICFSLFLTFNLSAQQYTAAEYWKMENDTAYVRLLQKQSAGVVLSAPEQLIVTEHKVKLEQYFEKMSDNEKSFYYQNRAMWAGKPGEVDKAPKKMDQEVFEGEKSLFSKYLVSSGFFGYLYGWSIIGLFDLDDEGVAAGLPFVTAGVATLLPLITIKDKYVSYNSLQLSMHGKSMGAFQGAALGVLLTGDNADENEKLILGLATVSSITLGHVGYYLGREKPWTKGRVALYSHYGTLMPFEGLAIEAAFELEDPRIYAATFLTFGAAGYFIADYVSRQHDYTKGDIVSTQTLTVLNSILGFGLIPNSHYDDELVSSDLLLPALGAMGGTIMGHLWLKNARLTNQQGRNTALASAGGGVLGLGITALFSPENVNPYFLIPYVTGMTSYGLLVSKYKRENNAVHSDNEGQGKWKFNIMPQNIFLNRSIASYALANPQKRAYMLPAFSASLNF